MDVDFIVNVCEVVGLVGDNVVGKLIFVKIIVGVFDFIFGEICINGEQVEIFFFVEVNWFGIVIVFQDFVVCENFDVIVNVFFGCELCIVKGMLCELEMEQVMKQVLSDFVVNIFLICFLLNLFFGGQWQVVVIVRIFIS